MTKLILTDIDGTILPFGQREVSDRVRAAFHAAIDAGIHIGPASGRDLPHIRPTFGGDDACVATATATNGMQAYLDGELICEKHIDRAGLEHIRRVIGDFEGCGLIVFEADGTPLLVEGDREVLRKSFPVYAETCVPQEGLPDIDIVKANVFVDGGLERTREAFEFFSREVGEVSFNLPMPGFLNMTPLGWSKASAIDVLCEALGIGLDEVVVFGDSGNDLEMLEHVPHSVAVANATDEAKAAAAHHIGSCDDEAVADAIFALAAGRPAW